MAKERGKTNRQVQRDTHEIVDPRWLLRAFGILVLVALVCGYGTLCLLFYQGQWQFMLHPKQSEARPPLIGGLPYELVRFGPDSSGIPQRTGWWMPARQEERYGHLTLLYLPAGDGSLEDATPTLDALRGLGCAVLAIDYRGYGASRPVHLSEATMRADAEAAWSYLVQQRHVREDLMVPVGSGVGGSLALGLTASHRQTPVVILDEPRFDVVGSVSRDPRVHLLPVRLLLHDRFAVEAQLATSRVPKLLVLRNAEANARAQGAADPKMTVELPRSNGMEYTQAIRRFLDLYAPPTPVTPLVPKPVR